MMQDRVVAVVAKTFNLAPESVTMELGTGTCEKWDSLGHIRVILAVEAEFGVRFRAMEIPDLNCVAAIVRKLGELGRS
jgi:acyl carrier protein